MLEKAEELGRLISQTPEWSYLDAANRDIAEDREATETLGKLRSLQDRMLEHIGQNEEPPEELAVEFQTAQEAVQQSARYQSLISSQANFDKLMHAVQHAIGEGIDKGGKSRIIIPS